MLRRQILLRNFSSKTGQCDCLNFIGENLFSFPRIEACKKLQTLISKSPLQIILVGEIIRKCNQKLVLSLKSVP